MSKKQGPASLDRRVFAFQSRDPSLIPSRGNIYRAMAEKMCDFDFSNNSGKLNAIYWFTEKAEFTLSV